MRHVTDTGKQIEQDMQRRHGRSGCDTAEESRAQVDQAHQDEEQPEHPVAAMGAAVMAIAALVLALVVTAMFFVATVAALPVLIIGGGLLGVWAFWSWGKRRRTLGH